MEDLHLRSCVLGQCICGPRRSRCAEYHARPQRSCLRQRRSTAAASARYIERPDARNRRLEMNIGNLKYAIAVLLGGLLSACAVIPVSTNVNAALASSVQCHTFAWAGAFRGGPLTATLANPVNEAHLRSAIETHLQAVGVRLDASNPDC